MTLGSETEDAHAIDDDGSHPRGADVSLRTFGGWLVGLGAIGLVAAFSLTVEKFKLLEDPGYRPSCDLNPVLSCGSVMVTDQASAFGFPNPLLGLIGFTAVLTLGVLLVAGVSVPRWVLVGQGVGAVLGLVFIHWLAFQSLYRINALCPWCMVVWAVTIPTALFSVLVVARVAGSRAAGSVWSVRYLLILFWYLAFGVLILIRFWDFWSTQL